MDYQAVVAVRVPREDGGDLTSSAKRRLETASEVQTVEVREVCGLDPALSATVVTLAVEIRAPTLDRAAVEHRLDNAPGTERVEQLQY
jgi:serine kinase of HPr protein (carbohydrate metabolism regulator)